MSGEEKKNKRFITIELNAPPLRKDIFLLQGFSGHEAISRLFSFQLDLLSTQASLAFDKIIGRSVTITIEDGNQTPRYFNGYISHLSRSGQDERFTHYQAEMVPWLWFLKRSAGCRIFQGKKKLTDILGDVFKKLGFKAGQDYQIKAHDTFSPWEYCVQYRETDFNFVSRLMEQYGFFYYFEHDKDRHTLIVGNEPKHHGEFRKKVYFVGSEGKEDRLGIISTWQQEAEVRAGRYALKDYHHGTPNNRLYVNRKSKVKLDDEGKAGDNKKYEIYDYASEYDTKEEGEDLAKLRMEEEEASGYASKGASDCVAFAAGRKFTVESKRKDGPSGSYVLTEVQHMASAGSYASGDGGNGEGYSNHFTCIPHTTCFRPARVTPKPVIPGVQTAVVVGNKGDEICTNKNGEIKVQFHWDRDGKHDDQSSCWVRVATLWAGKGWGTIFIPRIGQEVVVAFLEGDPDQPLIVGSVYNAQQVPPGNLPNTQMTSGIKTRSTPSGGKSNYNELAFEDKKGSERVYFHAEKDFKRVVEEFDGLEVGNGQEIVIKRGDQATKIDLGQATTEAMKSIELKVGQSTIKIDQTGITIKGMTIKIEGQVQTEIKGAITQLNGDGILKVKGGLVMIN